jgi:small-conductance mechanosensitive channel
MHLKRIPLIVIPSLLAMGVLIAGAATAPGASDDQVLDYLRHTIDWYRSVTAFIQSPINTDEILFHDAIQQNALASLQLSFKFAHADADWQTADQKTATTAPSGANGSGTSKLQQAAAQAAQRVAALQAQLDALNAQGPSTNPTSQPAIDARRDKLKAALNLAQLRLQVIQDRQLFSNGGSEGLEPQIDNLERPVPEADSQAAKFVPPPAVIQQATTPETAGIIGLITELFTLQRRMSDVNTLAAETAKRADANTSLRDPLRAMLTQTIRRSDVLVQGRDSEDPAVLDAERAEIESITSRYKNLSATLAPLSEQNDMIVSAAGNFQRWHDALERDYKRVLRSLVIRLGAMAAALLIVMAVSKIWRQVTFRYVTDIRRRRQFLVVRRLIVGSFVIIILVGGVVTEFGSLATYAGLLTAGIAVALQTVILSGVAHFFLIGRYGVRVGDRITIGGITGDVIEIGIFRLYLMELGGSHISLQPTGRVAVFANSVLFQPTAFFKQLPGAEYAWREMALTLSPESDYKLAEEQLFKAVDGVYSHYRPIIEQQHQSVSNALHVQIPPPHPEGRLRFVDAGLEYVVRYPVELRRADEIDDAVTRALVKAIEAEPKLKLVASGTPKIQAVAAPPA